MEKPRVAPGGNPRFNNWMRPIFNSFIIVCFQIAAVMACSGGHTVSEAYFRLLNWDSTHYENIAENGYQLPANGQFTSDDIHAGRANVVFFPGYPMLARAVHIYTGISVRLALLLVAQISALVVWLYFLLILRRSGWAGSAIPVLLAALAYPSSFFMVTGYTESLFLAGALGFIYWSDRWIEGRRSAWFVALLHGWVLSATRIVGFAVAAYPAFRDAVRRKQRFSSLALLALSVAASLAFFAYCQLKFGDWAIYFKLEEVGWQNHREYFAIINPLSYVPHFFFEETVDSFSRSAVMFMGILFIIWGVTEWKSGRPTEIRLARAAVAFTMFYIALTGKAAAKMDSMIRYTFPVYLLLILNFAELKPSSFSWRRLKIGFLLALGFGIGIWNMYRFTHGKWVA